ncbi:MAG: exodeoxyribonuclease III [Bacteroidales bacterium]|nr:exodeoxyribonuclease III [Bacteroidales bacterium]
MKILSWNVNGIRAQIGKDFFGTFKQLNPDILCIQETKAQSDTMPNLGKELIEYEIFFNYAVQKGYSGTSVLSRLKPVHHSNNIGREEHDQEGRVITLEYETFYLVNVYVPNSGQELKRLDYRKAWDQELLAYLRTLDARKPLIFTGDLNVAHEPIDLARPEENYNKTAGYTQVEIDGFKNFLNLGLVDTYRAIHQDRVQYSYWSMRFRAREKNLGWRIDYFLVSERLMPKIKDAFILDQVMGSDHCPVGIELEL